MGNSSSQQKVSDDDVLKYPEASANKRKYPGIVPKRFSTDVLFGIILIGCWVVMTLIGMDAMKNGDPYRLIGPSNSDGKICGYDTGLEDVPYLYTVTETGGGVCVNECPSAAIGTSSDPSNYICLEGISDVVYPITSTYISTSCFQNGAYDPTLTLSTCSCNLILPTKELLRRCYFDDSETRSLYVNQATPSYLTEFFADFMEIWDQILIFGFAVSLFLSFFFSHFLKYEKLTLFLTWFSVLSIFVLSVGFSFVAYTTAEKWEKLEGTDDISAHTQEDRELLQYASYAGFIFSFLFACSMIYLRKAINLAIKAMSLASMCIEKMPLIVFTPIGQCCAFLCFLLPTAYYASFLVSQGTFEKTFFENPITGDSTGVVSGLSFTFDTSAYVEEKMWFLFFCFLWTTNFIISIGFLIIALSTAQWFEN
jgi:choline transporter-like protein 2/4/5